MVGGIGHRCATGARGPTTRWIISRPAGNASNNLHNHIGRVIVHAECAELDAQCAELWPLMFGALASNVRSSTPWHRCAQRRKFGVSEIRNFHHIVILRIFCFGWTLLSCPLLSCSVVTLVSDRCPNQCGRKADRKRTRTALARSERGLVGNASPRGTIDPVPGTSRARRRADIVGHLSESKRTECGRKADRCPLRCGRKADRMRTRPRLWSVSLAGSAASLWTPSASSRWPTRFAADDFAPIFPHSVRRCRVISVSVRHRRSAREWSQHPLGASLAVKVRQGQSESGKVRFRPSDASQAECRGFESRLPLCGAHDYARRSAFPPSFAPMRVV